MTTASPMSNLIAMRSSAPKDTASAAVQSTAAGTGTPALPQSSTPTGFSGPAGDPMAQYVAMRQQAPQQAATAPGTAPTGDLAGWINQAEQITGVNPAQWTPGLGLIAHYESGGNPNAVNGQSVNGQNATGVMQTMPSTFSAYVPHQLAGAGIYDPVANIAAAIDYINSRYGGIANVPGVKSVNAGGGYLPY